MHIYFVMRLFFCSLICLISPCLSHAQDSLRNLAPLTITATRTTRSAADVAVPLTIISQKTIEKTGSLRLSDILQEQTGLNITNQHGQGVQLQGFDPEYTLILIDGEPIIGRTAGTLELSRIALGNVKQIEIVKGPSSSLYGSEALAGVINIITKNPTENAANASLQYGSNNTLDAAATANFRKDKTGATLFLNRYQSNGYDLVPQDFGQTVAPFGSNTAQLKLFFDPSNKLNFSVSGKYFFQKQLDDQNAGSFTQPILVNGLGTVTEQTINPQMKWRIAPNFGLQLRYYHAKYATTNQYTYINTQNIYDSSYFNQTFSRPELQIVYDYNPKNTLTLGMGNNSESVQATRYLGKKTFTNFYTFLQQEYKINPKLNATYGLSLNVHSVYGRQISPKMSILYVFSPKMRFMASIGRGFKAPDFRQLYLNFNNGVVGYSVLGSEEVKSGIDRFQQQGQIDQLFFTNDALGKLKAETSWALNLGTKYQISNKAQAEANFFYNQVTNLIETQVVARKTNGQNIFSYFNVSNVVIKGLETNVNYQFLPSVNVAAGYQLLGTSSLQAVAQIESGTVFRRNEQGQTVLVTKKDYGGLFNRSTHTANAKITYENAKNNFGAALRFVYRSRFGFGDVNGNLILDDATEYASGYLLVNLAVNKSFFQNKITAYSGINNALNYQNPLYLPNLMGIQYFLGIRAKLN